MWRAVWALAVAGLAWAPVPASGSVCDVTAHGAAGDGVTLDTAAFEAALAECTKRGGGTVHVPAGRYVIGAVELASHLTLELAAGATLLGSRDPAHYPLVETRFEGRMGRGHAALVSAR